MIKLTNEHMYVSNIVIVTSMIKYDSIILVIVIGWCLKWKTKGTTRCKK